MQLLVHAIVAAVGLLQHAQALPDLRPIQTVFKDLGGDALGFTPRPTAVVKPRDDGFFVKRANTPGPTCGFISGNFDEPITCAPTQYCAANPSIGAFGCCDSYIPMSNGGMSFTSCVYRTTCYDSTAQGQCTGDCASNTLNGFCKNSASPYCQTISLVDLTLSGYGCNTLPQYTVRARYSPTTTFSVPSATDKPAQGISNDGGVATTSPTSTGAGTSPTQAAGSGGKSSVVGPAVGGAVGGLAVVVIAVGLGIWLRLKHNKHKRLAAAAASAVGSGVGGAGTPAGPGGYQGSGYANGAAAGAGSAYVANQYYKPEQDHTNGHLSNGHEANVPAYPGPPINQTYPTETPHSPVMSEMPSSPAITNPTHSTMFTSHMPPSEVEGTSSPPPLSPTISSIAPTRPQRRSVGSNSVLSGSAADRTELDNTSTSVQPAQSNTAATSSQTDGQGPSTFQAGQVTDWSKPYHEINQ